MLKDDSDSKLTLSEELDSEEVPGIEDWLDELLWDVEVSEEGTEESGVGNNLDPVLGLEVENSLESSSMGSGRLGFTSGGRKRNLLSPEWSTEICLKGGREMVSVGVGLGC